PRASSIMLRQRLPGWSVRSSGRPILILEMICLAFFAKRKMAAALTRTNKICCTICISNQLHVLIYGVMMSKMNDSKKYILNAEVAEKKLRRIALEIIENN